MSQNPSSTPTLTGIYYTHPDQKKKVVQLSRSLGLPIITECAGYDFVLSFVHDKLSLSMPNDRLLKGQVFAEFVEGAAGYRRKHGKKEMLLRAIGFHKGQPLSILDATGGMGKDSFLMASYGCNVHVIERNRIVAALLQDGLNRATKQPETCNIARNIQLSILDSQKYLHNLIGSEKQYDVIYLDPMFPERSKRSLVKKEMQMLQKLVGNENDPTLLLAAALSVARKRVVAKRPKTALPIANDIPSHNLCGKTTRYDVYMVK